MVHVEVLVNELSGLDDLDNLMRSEVRGRLFSLLDKNLLFEYSKVGLPQSIRRAKWG